MKLIKLNPKQKWAVISDTHIGHGFEFTEHIQQVLDNNQYIIFCGDIFELFVHTWDEVRVGKGAWLVKWMRENPKRFSYIVGNHDADMWDENLPFPVYETVKVTQNKKTFLCIHGHQFDKMNRHRMNPWGRFITRVEVLLSKILRTNIQHFLSKRIRISFFTRWVRRIHLMEIRDMSKRYANISGCDYLFHGHSHFRNIDKTSQNTVIDIGGFMIGESYLEVENGLPAVKIIK